MRKSLTFTCSCKVWSLWLPCRCPNDSLVLPTFGTARFAPPSVPPVWCCKIAWCHSYRTTTMIPWLFSKKTHRHFSIQRFVPLDSTFPWKRTEHAGPIVWLSCSSYLRTSGFGPWGSVKHVVCIPPKSTALRRLQQHVSETVKTADWDVLQQMWGEDCCGDIWRVTECTDVEQL